MISPKPKTINNNLSIMNVLKSFPKQVHSNNVTKYLGTVISLQTWSFSSRQMASRGSLGLFLAGVSPVFRAWFYGPMKEMERVVEAKDTIPEAFGTMIDYIYRAPDSDFSLEDIKCPQELFELLAVADRYEILILVELTIEALEFFDITNENMIFAATVAQKYRLLHVDVLVDVSKRLLLKCLNFLNSSTNGRDIYALVAETKKNFPEASLDVLYELIDLGNETYGQPGAEYETLPKAQRTRGLSLYHKMQSVSWRTR